MRLTDTRADEQERGITIKSTGISLFYEMTDDAMKNFKGEKNGNGYLVRLSGHQMQRVDAAIAVFCMANTLLSCAIWQSALVPFMLSCLLSDVAAATSDYAFSLARAQPFW